MNEVVSAYVPDSASYDKWPCTTIGECPTNCVFLREFENPFTPAFDSEVQNCPLPEAIESYCAITQPTRHGRILMDPEGVAQDEGRSLPTAGNGQTTSTSHPQVTCSYGVAVIPHYSQNPRMPIAFRGHPLVNI